MGPGGAAGPIGNTGGFFGYRTWEERQEKHPTKHIKQQLKCGRDFFFCVFSLAHL